MTDKNSYLSAKSIDTKFNLKNPSHQNSTEKEGPISEATRHAIQADSFQKSKNFQQAIDENYKAHQCYLAALASLKNRDANQEIDADTIQSIELMAKTHKRKAKLLEIRQKTGAE
jgi:hypothetical protein